MKRRLLGLAVVGWLLLLMATLAVWVRGYFAAEGWVINALGTPVHVVSVRGGLYFAMFSGYTDAVRTQWNAQPADDFSRMFSNGAATCGFRYVTREYAGQTFRAAVVPHWFLAIVLAAALWICRRAYQRAPRFTGRGRCSSCGYDIRATPQRCPECGAVPTPSPS